MVVSYREPENGGKSNSVDAGESGHAKISFRVEPGVKRGMVKSVLVYPRQQCDSFLFQLLSIRAISLPARIIVLPTQRRIASRTLR